jgi:hypothetical protein
MLSAGFIAQAAIIGVALDQIWFSAFFAVVLPSAQRV